MKNAVTFEELKRFIVESIEDEIIDYPDFDVDGALSSGNYIIEGERDYLIYDNPPAKLLYDKYSNIGRFVINLFQKEGNKFLNLLITVSYVLADNSSWLFYSDKKVEHPYKYANGHDIGCTHMVGISEELKNKFTKNSKIKKLIKDFILENSDSDDDNYKQEYVDECLAYLSKTNTRLNNYYAKIGVEKARDEAKEREEYKKRMAIEEPIKNYANKRQKELGRTYYYYKEYYRGSDSIAHDDDYEGSGEEALGFIAIAMGCKSEKDVDELIDRLHKHGSISKVKGSYRIIYSEKK